MEPERSNLRPKLEASVRVGFCRRGFIKRKENRQRVKPDDLDDRAVQAFTVALTALDGYCRPEVKERFYQITDGSLSFITLPSVRGSKSSATGAGAEMIFSVPSN